MDGVPSIALYLGYATKTFSNRLINLKIYISSFCVNSKLYINSKLS